MERSIRKMSFIGAVKQSVILILVGIILLLPVLIRSAKYVDFISLEEEEIDCQKVKLTTKLNYGYFMSSEMKLTSYGREYHKVDDYSYLVEVEGKGDKEAKVAIVCVEPKLKKKLDAMSFDYDNAKTITIYGEIQDFDQEVSRMYYAGYVSDLLSLDRELVEENIPDYYIWAYGASVFDGAFSTPKILGYIGVAFILAAFIRILMSAFGLQMIKFKKDIEKSGFAYEAIEKEFQNSEYESKERNLRVGGNFTFANLNTNHPRMFSNDRIEYLANDWKMPLLDKRKPVYQLKYTFSDYEKMIVVIIKDKAEVELIVSMYRERKA